MRIILLTILFVLPFYFFTRKENTSSQPSIDSIKVKLSGLQRQKKIISSAPEKPSIAEKAALSPVVVDPPQEQLEDDPIGPTEGVPTRQPAEINSEHFAEVETSDTEDSWNSELKEMLARLEPEDSEEIHKSYLMQQEAYRLEVESLLNEKSQKTTDEAALEIDYLLSELDQRHQYRLKEILGAHYEAVGDHYEDFMDEASSREE